MVTDEEERRRRRHPAAKRLEEALLPAAAAKATTSSASSQLISDDSTRTRPRRSALSQNLGRKGLHAADSEEPQRPAEEQPDTKDEQTRGAAHAWALTVGTADYEPRALRAALAGIAANSDVRTVLILASATGSEAAEDYHVSRDDGGSGGARTNDTRIETSGDSLVPDHGFPPGSVGAAIYERMLTPALRRCLDIRIIEAPLLACPHADARHAARYQGTYMRFDLWRMVEYERIVYIDLDFLVLSPCFDALFHYAMPAGKELAAARYSSGECYGQGAAPCAQDGPLRRVRASTPVARAHPCTCTLTNAYWARHARVRTRACKWPQLTARDALAGLLGHFNGLGFLNAGMLVITPDKTTHAELLAFHEATQRAAKTAEGRPYCVTDQPLLYRFFDWKRGGKIDYLSPSFNFWPKAGMAAPTPSLGAHFIGSVESKSKPWRADSLSSLAAGNYTTRFHAAWWAAAASSENEGAMCGHYHRDAAGSR